MHARLKRSKFELVAKRRDEVAKMLGEYTPTGTIASTMAEKYGVSTRIIHKDIAEIRASWRKLAVACTLEERLDQAVRAREQLIGQCLGADAAPDRATALRAMDSLAQLLGLDVERAAPAEIRFHFGSDDSGADGES